MGTNAVHRLVQALELLGYQHTKKPHHKFNLIHAIQLHAGLIGDKELEAVCDREIERIKAESKAAF